MKIGWANVCYFLYIVVLLVGFPTIIYLFLIGLPVFEKIYISLNWILTVANSYSIIYGLISLTIALVRYCKRRKYYFWDSTRGSYVCVLDKDVQILNRRHLIPEQKYSDLPLDLTGSKFPSITLVVPVNSIDLEYNGVPSVCCTSNFSYYSFHHIEYYLREIGELAYDPEATVNVVVVFNENIKPQGYKKNFRELLLPLEAEYKKKYGKTLFLFSLPENGNVINLLNQIIELVKKQTLEKTTYMAVLAPEEHFEKQTLMRVVSLFNLRGVDGIQYRNILLDNQGLIGSIIGTEMELSYNLRGESKVFLQEIGLFAGGVGFWKTSVLEQLGFNPHALFQGIDLTIRALAENYKVTYSNEIIIYRELNLGCCTFLKLKVLWCRGWIRNNYNNLSKVLKSSVIGYGDKIVQILLFIYSEVIYYLSVQSIPVFTCFALMGGYALDLTFLATTIAWILLIPVNVFIVGISSRLTSDLFPPQHFKSLRWWNYLAYLIIYPIYDYLGFFISIVAHLRELSE